MVPIHKGELKVRNRGSFVVISTLESLEKNSQDKIVKGKG